MYARTGVPDQNADSEGVVAEALWGQFEVGTGVPSLQEQSVPYCVQLLDQKVML